MGLLKDSKTCDIKPWFSLFSNFSFLHDFNTFDSSSPSVKLVVKTDLTSMAFNTDSAGNNAILSVKNSFGEVIGDTAMSIWPDISSCESNTSPELNVRKEGRTFRRYFEINISRAEPMFVLLFIEEYNFELVSNVSEMREKYSTIFFMI